MDLEKYFEKYPGTPGTRAGGSIRNGNTKRFDKGKEQLNLLPVDVQVIIDYTNDFLNKIGIKTIENPIVKFGKNEDCHYTNLFAINYKLIKSKNGLYSQKDIIWMKFTKNGHLGIVMQGDNIDFDFPQNEEDYKKKNNRKWKFPTSGVIIHYLGEEWNNEFVLLFPLTNMPKHLNRYLVRRGIGNYLIDKGVPILDFYSHNY